MRSLSEMGWPAGVRRSFAAVPWRSSRAAGGSGPVGAILVVMLAVWAVVAHPGAPGTVRFAGLVLVGMLAWNVGALLAWLRPILPGLALAATVGALFVAGYPAALDKADSPPLGYENANVALIAAATVGLLAAARAAPKAARVWLYAGAVTTPFVTHYIGSRAGTITCVLLLAVWPLTRWATRRFWQLTSGGVLVAGVLLVIGLAATYDSQADPSFMDDTLTEERVVLWSDALDQVQDHPVLGVGPGNFALLSPLARSDADLAWAHSAPMQVLAELGVVGFVLLAALVAWMIWRLGRASVVLTVLALQPMIDYVLDFTLVVAAIAFILGTLSDSRLGPPPR